ncbi:unnamed protein product [Amoebophrya sp. A120]|nr:unnamed protein product [Amoebophrya sp. A120]|eukprot:GSA120T00021050001.1
MVPSSSSSSGQYHRKRPAVSPPDQEPKGAGTTIPIAGEKDGRAEEVALIPARGGGGDARTGALKRAKKATPPRNASAATGTTAGVVLSPLTAAFKHERTRAGAARPPEQPDHGRSSPSSSKMLSAAAGPPPAGSSSSSGAASGRANDVLNLTLQKGTSQIHSTHRPPGAGEDVQEVAKPPTTTTNPRSTGAGADVKSSCYDSSVLLGANKKREDLGGVRPRSQLDAAPNFIRVAGRGLTAVPRYSSLNFQCDTERVERAKLAKLLGKTSQREGDPPGQGRGLSSEQSRVETSSYAPKQDHTKADENGWVRDVSRGARMNENLSTAEQKPETTTNSLVQNQNRQKHTSSATRSENKEAASFRKKETAESSTNARLLFQDPPANQPSASKKMKASRKAAMAAAMLKSST